MLPADVIKTIKRIHIKSGRTVNTVLAGHYRSVFRGVGIEFEEVRAYSPGDEVKSIDWKVSARMGRPYIKLYREERELVVMLLVDVSASGAFGTERRLKQETAAEIASILAFNAVRNNDKVGAILFSDQVEAYIPPQKGSGHVWRVIKAFFDHERQHRGTDINVALDYLGRVARKRTVAFLISDFLSPPYARRLRVAAQKHEIIGVVLSDPGEFRLPAAGIFQARDLESGRTLLLDAADRRTRSAFEATRRRHYDQTLQTLKAGDIDAVPVRTGEAVADTLIQYFRRRERRHRP
jgi:uncharacterized protein (DUF58 family)